MMMDGVVEGVNVGGNCSGIATPQGFVYFDERFAHTPLVFVRVLGVIPKETNGRKNYEKRAQPGDYIVMVGGRVGKDGIHGATFSSEALDSGSPATAVQIGDPITQKKMSDAIVKEARDLDLYDSITDDGAGGLASSVGEMAKESGGFHLKLHDVPLKYPGLADWEIFISESQERMTLSVPKEKWPRLKSLMERRGVEATVIGEFTDSGKCIVEYEGKNIIDLDMDFVHHGLPPKPIRTTYERHTNEEPDIPLLENLTDSLHSMLGRKNIASISFISQQYDHEVQGGSVLKPLQGRGRINGDAAASRPILNSMKAAIISQGINPSYSDIDTYHMAASALDTAVRNVIAAGGNLDELYLMDNFCWCSSDDPQRMGELKEAVRACHDYAIAYGTPFISGKDSMYNDFKGFDHEGKPVKISIPPTLLVSSLGIVDDARNIISLDAKIPGDLIYVLGQTNDELGGSEYFAMYGEQTRGKKYIGNDVPVVDAQKNIVMYNALTKAISLGLVASAQSIHKGGLAVALAKTAMGGMLGVDVCIDCAPGFFLRDDTALYSESQGRILVTVDPEKIVEFERVMSKCDIGQIGEITNNDDFIIKGRNNREILHSDIRKMHDIYMSTFRGY